MNIMAYIFLKDSLTRQKGIFQVLYCTLSEIRREHICIFGQEEDQWCCVLFARSLSCVLFFCDPMNSSPPGSSFHGISQARILEWVPMSSCRGSSQPRNRTHVSCIGKWILLSLSHRESPSVDDRYYLILLYFTPDTKNISPALQNFLLQSDQPTVHAVLVGLFISEPQLCYAGLGGPAAYGEAANHVWNPTSFSTMTCLRVWAEQGQQELLHGI